ncbi:MAG: TolC family protein, partial [Tepidisphaeraceae bacterium]
ADLLSSESPFSTGQPITLRQALDLANRQNERLAIEGENYLQALIDRKRAGSAFLPTIALTPIYSARQPVPSNSGDGNLASSSQQNRFLDVPINGRFQLSPASDLSRLGRDAKTIDERRGLLLHLQESILLETARVYYDVLRAERSTDVLENSLQVQDARVRDIVGRQQAGLARPLDVAQTEAQAAATRVLLITARSDVRNGRTILAFLTAAPVQESPLVDQFNAPSALPPIDAIQQIAFTSRRDLQASESARLAARQNVEVAFGQYYPSVTLNGDLFLYRESVPDQREWSAFISANVPIFSAGLIHQDVREAWSIYRQAAAGQSLLRRQVIEEVAVAFQNLQTNQQRIAELQVQLQAAQQAFNQADQSYAVGLATNLERVAAQEQLLSAQLQLTSAQFDRTLSYLSLAFATGTLRSRLENPPATTQPANNARP